jgi:hypothetical protein
MQLNNSDGTEDHSKYFKENRQLKPPMLLQDIKWDLSIPDESKTNPVLLTENAQKVLAVIRQRYSLSQRPSYISSRLAQAVKQEGMYASQRKEVLGWAGYRERPCGSLSV